MSLIKLPGTARIGGIAALFLLCMSFCACATARGRKAKKKEVVHAMTVAFIRPANKGDDFVRVSFLQSARFYKLPLKAKPAYMELLQQSQKLHKPVTISRASEESDIILTVTEQK